MFECFPNLVGITDKECPCHSVPSGKSYNITESTSGEFLTDYFDIEAAALQDCDSASDMFDEMNKAIVKAKKDLITDFESALKKKYNTSFSKFVNEIGTSQHRSTNTEAVGLYSGVKLQTTGVEGSYMRISSISVRSLQDQGSVRVQIIDSTGTQLYSSDALSLVANQITKVEPNLVLPLFWNEDETLEYYIVHNITKPYRTKPNCSCSGHSVKYKKFVYPYGVKTSNANALTIDAYESAQTSFSVQPKVEISCHMEQAVCDNATTEDREVLASTILYRAAQWLAEQRLQSNNIGRYTLLSAEGLAAKVDECSTEYDKGIEWLVQNMTMPQCLICKPGAWKQMIKV